MKKTRFKWNRIEKLAVKFEDSGFGRVDEHGITWHSFSPSGLKRFVIAVSSNKPTRPRKKRKHRKG